MTTSTDERWVPPAGMDPEVVKAWRSFYGSIRLKYGMSARFYRALYLAQSGRCYICRKAKGVHPDDPKGRGGRRLGVDHNHMIGEGKIEAVRALVCTGSLSANTCNRLIARYDAAALERAVEVLSGAPAQRLWSAMAMASVATDEPLTDWQNDVLITGWLTR